VTSHSDEVDHDHYLLCTKVRPPHRCLLHVHLTALPSPAQEPQHQARGSSLPHGPPPLPSVSSSVTWKTTSQAARRQWRPLSRRQLPWGRILSQESAYLPFCSCNRSSSPWEPAASGPKIRSSSFAPGGCTSSWAVAARGLPCRSLSIRLCNR